MASRIGCPLSRRFSVDPLPNADVIVMGRVFHNWDLATKMMLLRKRYDALPVDGALIVSERLIDDERRSSTFGLLASVNMLIMTAGGSTSRTRTASAG
jgi:hypothetical protein